MFSMIDLYCINYAPKFQCLIVAFSCTVLLTSDLSYQVPYWEFHFDVVREYHRLEHIDVWPT